MRLVYGLEVFETLEEVLRPRHTALLVVDMQRDFCSPEGHFDQSGKDLSMTRAIVPRLTGLVEEARRAGALVVFIQNTTLPNGLSDSPAWIYGHLKTGLRLEGTAPYTLEGSEGQEIIPELAPRPSEPVVKKFRSSAFHNTVLDSLLKSRGIQSVVVTGVVTQGCVLATWRDATFHDYYTAVVPDCVASYKPDLHDAALKIMAMRDAPSSQEIQGIWSASRVAVTGRGG